MTADGSSSQNPLLIERDGAVETLVINDFPRNRMGLAFMDALEAQVERLADDASVRAVVIRGAGEENFSVGMDLKQLPEGIARMGSAEAVFDQRLRVLDAIELAEMPAVAVEGVLRCVVGAGEKPLSESIAEERRAVLSTMGTPDQREGIQAFLEKREPRFNRESH